MKAIYSSFNNFVEKFSDSKEIISNLHSSRCFYTESSPSSSASTCTSPYASECEQDSLSESAKIQSTSKQESNKKPKSTASYKKRTKFCCRKSECALLQQKYPGKVPLIVERFQSEKRLPFIEKCQFVVPKTVTVGQLQHVIRERIMGKSNMAVFIIVKGELPSLTATVEELVQRHRDEDGFLYLNFSSEEYFG